MIKYKKTLLVILSIFLLSNKGHSQNIYTNDMDYVLGDAKQAFIQNRINTQAQADNLLKGFKAMKVNGIRIPIFPRDTNGVDINPNKPMMDYFYREALAQGFFIFANPAQGGGGGRIANNSLSHEGGVNGSNDASIELILRVLEFVAEYPDCKWINPFNEDGRATSSTWTVEQYHFIYQSLYNNLFNIELIGPCTWGLPAAIDMLENTNIEDYITVATSHNLGFNHTLWDDFIELADEENLPVWDSEVNHNNKFPNDALRSGTRLERALEYGVDGLVLYNSWNTVNLTTGTISAGMQDQMLLYLKQDLSTKIVDQIELNIHPNPVVDKLYIDAPNDVFKKIEVYNINGKLITQQKVNTKNLEINMSNYSEGVYVVKLEGDKFSGTYKVIKD